MMTNTQTKFETLKQNAIQRLNDYIKLRNNHEGRYVTTNIEQARMLVKKLDGLTAGESGTQTAVDLLYEITISLKLNNSYASTFITSDFNKILNSLERGIYQLYNQTDAFVDCVEHRLSQGNDEISELNTKITEAERVRTQHKYKNEHDRNCAEEHGSYNTSDTHDISVDDKIIDDLKSILNVTQKTNEDFTSRYLKFYQAVAVLVASETIAKGPSAPPLKEAVAAPVASETITKEPSAPPQEYTEPTVSVTVPRVDASNLTVTAAFFSSFSVVPKHAVIKTTIKEETTPLSQERKGSIRNTLN